jgi:MurNAc alpha-1-phosphate uridylyltransferase
VHHLGEQIASHLGASARIVREERLLETGGSVKNALPLLGDGPYFILNGDGLWRDGPCPMLSRMEAAWDSARMDALLLLHPLATAIGREAKDRGDYFLDADGRARHRAAAAAAPYLFASVSVCDSRLGVRFAAVPRVAGGAVLAVEAVDARRGEWPAIRPGP